MRFSVHTGVQAHAAETYFRDLETVGSQLPRLHCKPRHSRGAQVVNRKPKYHRLKQMQGTDERLCNGPIRLSVIGCSLRALCRSD